MSLHLSESPLRRSGRTTRPEPHITIGALSKEFKVTLRTLRFYEDRGLLVPHRQGTARLYTQNDRAKLQEILRLKHLGFTLTEIRDIIAQDGRKPNASGLKLRPEQILAQIAYLERQRKDIDGAIALLRNAQQAA